LEPEFEPAFEAQPDAGFEPAFEPEPESADDGLDPRVSDDLYAEPPDAAPRARREPRDVFGDPEDHFVVDDVLDDGPDDQATPGTTTDRAPNRDD